MSWRLVLVLQAILTLYQPVYLIKYARRRQSYPIRVWRAKLAVVAGVAIVLQEWVLMIIMAFDNVPVVAAAVILVVLQSLSIDAIVWQSACMFHQLRIVKQQIIIAQMMATGDTSSLSISRRRSLPRKCSRSTTEVDRSRWFLSVKAMIGFMAINWVLAFLPVIVILSLHRDLLQQPAGHCYDRLWSSCGLMVSIVWIKFALTLSVPVIVASLSQDIIDISGMRWSLKKLGMLLIGNYGLLAVLMTFVPVVGAVFGNLSIVVLHAVFYILIIRAVRASQPRNNDASVVPDNEVEMFLSVPSFFRALQTHAEAEFCVENVLFWKAATDFKGVFGAKDPVRRVSSLGHGHLIGSMKSILLAGKPKIMQKEAINVFNTYIAPGAPLEINVDSQVLIDLREDVFSFLVRPSPSDTKVVPEDVEISDALLESTKITPTTFDDAKRQIEKLIANDILPRFRCTDVGRAIWTEFQRQSIRQTRRIASSAT
ncbi:RGS domain-containing protein [Plasmodiophora brassicae]|uniref:RGS domain-containing protein n=1 Tax=Plasmodiophora brassicae TaxID=37360 RepID=A0A0G4IS34_PLABS|nr:hypothetical protein PBRA_006174 [Plasmodiophora brassicae]